MMYKKKDIDIRDNYHIDIKFNSLKKLRKLLT